MHHILVTSDTLTVCSSAASGNMRCIASTPEKQPWGKRGQSRRQARRCTRSPIKKFFAYELDNGAYNLQCGRAHRSVDSPHACGRHNQNDISGNGVGSRGRRHRPARQQLSVGSCGVCDWVLAQILSIAFPEEVGASCSFGAPATHSAAHTHTCGCIRMYITTE